MDSISSSGKHYKEISSKASGYFVTFLTIYMVFVENNIRILDEIEKWALSLANNDGISALIQVAFMFVSAGGIYSAIYAIVYKVYCRKWKKSHKNIWIKGIWLHIHDKENLRIGVVRIKQDFCTLKVKGYNFDPTDTGATDRVVETSWNYKMGKIVDNGEEDYVLGYYSASRGMKNKSGIHNLRILSSKDGEYPSSMSGTFHDTITDEGQNVADSMGVIHLFRLEEESPLYSVLNLRDDQEICFRLSNLVRRERDKYSDEIFIKKFEEIVAKHPRLSEKFNKEKAPEMAL